MSNYPTLSIITICFNNLEEVKKTVESIDNQSVLPFEHIIINGSTSGDIADYFLNINTLIPAYRQIINELDGGISDAFNKGIQLAKSEIIHLLNSGDVYADITVIKNVLEVFKEKGESIKWLHGKYIQYQNNKEVTSGVKFDKNLIYRGMRQCAHPTMFIKTELYNKHGLFSLSKKIAMDYDFIIRIKDEPFFYLEKVIIKFAPDGVSNQNILEGLKEVRESYFTKFGFSFKLIIWQIRVYLIHLIKKIGK